MQFIILFFGVLLVVAGLMLLLKPGSIIGFLGRNKDSTGIHVMAVVARLLLGGVLFVYSDQSGFPLTFKILGGITLVAAVVLAVMGRSNFRKLMAWAMGLADKIGRLAGIAAIALGGFLVYAVI